MVNEETAGEERIHCDIDGLMNRIDPPIPAVMRKEAAISTPVFRDLCMQN